MTVRLSLLMFGSSLCALEVSAAEWNQEMLKELRPFSGVIGSWSGEGTSATAAGWKEKIDCTWGFRESDGRVSLNFYITGGFLDAILLTYDPQAKTYKAALRDKKENVLRFEGKPAGEQTLRLQRTDEGATDGYDRLEIKLLRAGDKLMYTLGKKKGRTLYDTVAQAETFREGDPLDDFKNGPRCVVTGAAGRVAVEHNGKTYHVACEETRKVFLKEPDKFIAAAEK